MLQIDDTRLILEAINKDGVEHASVLPKKRVKEFLLNGCKVTHVYYADSHKGVLIREKTTVDGLIISVDCKSIYQIEFGKVEIIYV